MRAVSIVAILLLLAANAAALLLAFHLVSVPADIAAYVIAPQGNAAPLPQAVSAVEPTVLVLSLGFGLIALMGILFAATPRDEAPAPVAEAVRPASAPPATNQSEAEIVSFLATLQAKGRLVDFLMDNINAYPDAQVGAAARVVHAGCKTVLDEHFRIQPIRSEPEQSKIEVPADYAADEYRLLGKISGQAPFTGALVHHGWKTDFVKLPAILRRNADRLPAIAPAEVDVK
jgi:Domain of unknown function (DUF2760)